MIAKTTDNNNNKINIYNIYNNNNNNNNNIGKESENWDPTLAGL